MVGSTARRVHPWLAGLFALGVLLQAFLAGAALPQLGGSGSFATHIEVGYTAMGIIALLVLIAAGLGRADRGQIWGSVALFVLYIVQTMLPTFKGSTPFLAALHPLNALVLFALAAWLFYRGVRTAPA
jgi:cytochrome c oxidase assembly factor CtaG